MPGLDASALGLYLSAILILFVYSFFLYKDNPFFHIAESLAIGVALSNGTVMAWKTINDLAWTPGILQGKDTAVWVACLVFSGLVFVRLTGKQYAWVSRWPLAVIVGTGIGIGIRGAMDAQFMSQIAATIMPVVGGRYTPLDNLVMIVFTLSIIAYFVFTREQKGPLKVVSTIARYAMMLTFGGTAGNVIFTRISNLGMRILIILQALGIVS